MAPTPAPVLANAKSVWGQTQNFMFWFTKLVTSFYAWSDGIIKWRQNKVNNEYKIKIAEEQASNIMEEQERNVNEVMQDIREGSKSVERAWDSDLLENLASHEELTELPSSVLD